MLVERQGHRFEVDPTDYSGEWGFWQRFADGTWEPEILDRMPALLADGGTFLDIGAWIGPHSLWASAVGAERVVAYEPDPMAFTLLQRNVPFGELHHAAIGPVTGTTTIGTAGDSTSRTGEGGATVACLTVEDATYDLGPVALVKIDIEGAESEVMDEAADDLRALDCPIFLSLHRWTSTHIPDRGWRVEEIASMEVLLWPA